MNQGRYHPTVMRAGSLTDPSPRLPQPSPLARRIRRLLHGAEFLLLGLLLGYAAVALNDQPDLLSRQLHRALTVLGLPTGPQAVPVTTSGRPVSWFLWPGSSTDRPGTEAPKVSFPLPGASVASPPAPSVSSEQARALSPLVVWEYRVPTPGQSPARSQQEVVQAAIEEFRERYPQVEVTVRWWNEADLVQNLRQALAGPKAELPDVAALPSPLLGLDGPLRLSSALTTELNSHLLPTVWPAIALPAYGKRAAAWMIPRWIEGRFWITSRPFWQKAGMDLAAVVQTGWTYDQVVTFLRRAVGSSGARSVRPPVLQLGFSADSWEAFLTAARVPSPYGWKEPTLDAPIPAPAELLWSAPVLQKILSAWKAWWDRLYPDPQRQTMARDAFRQEVFQWLPNLREGRPLLAGPVRPAAVRAFLRPFVFTEWAGETEQPSLASPVTPASAGGNSGMGGSGPSALAIVPIAGPQTPAPQPASVSGYVLFSRATGSATLRSQLAQELALLLARRTARWGAQEFAFVPAWRDDLEWARQYWLAQGEALGWQRMPEVQHWLETADRLTPPALLPEPLAAAREQAMQALAGLTASWLAGDTPGEEVDAQITRLLLAPIQSPGRQP
ncbi:MAG: extracellular solute-binding protein [Limnochordaceae bacterium]|nr:extracellular solute-binding protein [Limnochordaceae bacterium]